MPRVHRRRADPLAGRGPTEWWAQRTAVGALSARGTRRGRDRRGSSPINPGLGTCGPYWIRTSGLRIRSPTLYPTELRAQLFMSAATTGGKGGIRTLDTGYPVYWFSKPAPSASRPPFQNLSLLAAGGGGRIRTFGGREPSTVFKTAAFDRSATPPKSNSSVNLPPSRGKAPGPALEPPCIEDGRSGIKPEGPRHPGPVSAPPLAGTSARRSAPGRPGTAAAPRGSAPCRRPAGTAPGSPPPSAPPPRPSR